MFEKVLKVITILFLLAIFSEFNVVNASNDPVNIYLFYGEGCPHCAKEKLFLNSLKVEYQNNIQIHQYEVYYSEENNNKLNKVAELLGVNVAGVPFLVIGDKAIIGFDSASITGKEIEMNVINCLQNGCPDKASEILLGVRPTYTISRTNTFPPLVPTESKPFEENEVMPVFLNTIVFGTVDLKSVSLPLATILIALVDGFNPCAMWILIFLITMLINLKDKKKLYILGTVFIVTSGMVYFLFLAAWFNFFKYIGFVYWIKVIIGIVAIISGSLHLRDAFSSKGGCKATNAQQREGIMDRIKKALGEKSFILSVLGIMILAVSVNLIEVVCSAGLPAVYTNLLASVTLSPTVYYSYLLLYVLVFMLDDLIIFFIAIKTFEVTGIAKKYTKWSGIVGGIVLVIIGIILIVKPELLMFG